MPTHSTKPDPSCEFPPTRWSLVGRVGADETRVAGEALETLCRAYWYPLYAYLRRCGHSPDDAQDSTQSFFQYLLENRLLAKADQSKGRFRSFLLASLKNFLSSERRKQSAFKRGGARPLISLDEKSPEERYALEPVEEHTPESLFELSWARALLMQTSSAIEREYMEAGKRELFQHLRPYLRGGEQGPSYKTTATALGKSEDAVKSGVLRLRHRFQILLRAQIAHTVPHASDIDEELAHLRRVLAG